MMNVIMVTSNGYAKSTDEGEFRTTARAGKGVTGMTTSEKTGPVVAIMCPPPDATIMVITELGRCIRFLASEVRNTGRGATGVKAMDLASDDVVVDACWL
jgi:DNA gyrase subunit A